MTKAVNFSRPCRICKIRDFEPLSHYREFLRFAANRRELDSFYLLMSQKRAFIVFCSVTTNTNVKIAYSIATQVESLINLT